MVILESLVCPKCGNTQHFNVRTGRSVKNSIVEKKMNIAIICESCKYLITSFDHEDKKGESIYG